MRPRLAFGGKPSGNASLLLPICFQMFSQQNLKTVFSAVACLAAVLISSFAAEAAREIIPAIPEGRVVDTNTMQQIYDEVKTPFKYGVVLKGADTTRPSG